MFKLTWNLPDCHARVTHPGYTADMRPRAMAAVLIVLIYILGGQSVWGSSAGTTGADVLKIGVGARAIAMGEAYAAQADDVSALYWNPGGLALMQERQASFMYDQMYQGLNYSNVALGIPLENGAVGGSVS